MKTNMSDGIEAISYSCHILLPFVLKTKYVEFTNLEIKIKS